MAKPMKGLLLIAGKPPGGSPASVSPPSVDKGGKAALSSAVEDRSASEAFQAIKRGDEAAFKVAFIRAVRACVAREMAEGY